MYRVFYDGTHYMIVPCGSGLSLPPSPSFPFQQLPEAFQSACAMLKMAGVGTPIENYGVMITESEWLVEEGAIESYVRAYPSPEDDSDVPSTSPPEGQAW